MSSRRTLILVGAIAIGLVAALLLFNYVRGIEDRANNNAKRVDVYVAKTDIPQGTAGETAASDGSIGGRPDPAGVPSGQRHHHHRRDPEEGGAVRHPARTRRSSQDMFVDPAQSQISFRERLKNPEHVAITISVDQVRGVAGFLVPGDEVNLHGVPGRTPVGDGAGSPTRQSPSTAALPLPEGPDPRRRPEHAARPGRARPTPTAGDRRPPATPASSPSTCPPEAAQWIASAQQAGGLYLTLVGQRLRPRSPLPPIDPTSATLPGEDPAELTPYGPQGNQD